MFRKYSLRLSGCEKGPEGWGGAGGGGTQPRTPKLQRVTLSLFPSSGRLQTLSHSELEPQNSLPLRAMDLALPLLAISSQRLIFVLRCMDIDLMRVDRDVCPCDCHPSRDTKHFTPVVATVLPATANLGETPQLDPWPSSNFPSPPSF